MAPAGMMTRLPLPSSAGQGQAANAQLANGAQGPDVSAMLPESLQLLPLYVMALQKSTIYRGGDYIRSDERAALVYRMLTMPVVTCKAYIYPHLFSLHDMDNTAGRPDPAAAAEIIGVGAYAGPRVVMPSTCTLSAAVLSPAGCYLLDNGIEIYLWVGKEAPAGLVQALFGVQSLQGIDTNTVQLLDMGNDYSQRVCAIVRTLRATSTQAQKLRIVREGAGDVNEARFHWHMIEDRQQFQGGTVTYAEYAAIVYKESQMGHLGGT